MVRHSFYGCCRLDLPALLTVVLLAGGAAFGEDKPTGKPWLDMDYGPYMANTVELPQPAGNFAYKGIVLRVGDPKAGDERTMVFDTDTLRWAGGWTGGWLNLTGVTFDGAHWAYPTAKGAIAFANPVAPGWGKPGDDSADAFSDPRFRGNDQKPYGPMPRDWAQWKGLYVHGEHVVLSYTVGGAAILESAGRETLGDTAAFVRDVNIAPSKHALVMQVALRDADVRFTGKSDRATWIMFGHATGGAAKGDVDSKGLAAHWAFDEAPDGKVGAGQKDKFAAALTGATLGDGKHGKAIELTEKSSVTIADSNRLRLGRNDHTVAAWIKTDRDGTIISRAPQTGKWAPQGRTFFIRNKRLAIDVGWVGAVAGSTVVADNKWRHVAVTFEAKTNRYRLFVDGKVDAEGVLDVKDEAAEHVVRIGYTSPNFPSNDNRFRGAMDDLRIYERTLSEQDVAALAGKTPGDDVLALACLHDGSITPTWVTPDGQARLSIPPHDKPAHLRVLIWRGPAAKRDAWIDSLAKVNPPTDLAHWTKGGPSRYPQTLTTKAAIAKPKKGSPWVVDTLTAPDDNPWRSWMRFGGFDFFEGGERAAISTWSGDVWIVSGIKPDAELGELKWKRIATGLFQPLGVRIVDGQIYVTCRDQLTRLVDLNGDGETDFYEAFNHDHQVTEHFHEFAMDLQTDRDGNFYYAKSARHARDSLVEQHGTLIKVSKDGRTSQIIANGYRAANGVGVSPDGAFFTSDQEGHWMPANRINLVTPGSFSGNMFSYHRGEKPSDYDRPIVWLPKGFDRSPAEQVVVPNNRWGLPVGSVLSLSYGTGEILSILYERIEGVPRVNAQGAAFRIGVQFPTGVMRGRFHAGDGQLYTCGLFGWSSNRTSPGGFFRVRYTGEKVHQPVAWRVVKDGVVLRFQHPLDEETATDAESYLVEQWNYKWTANYGSPEFKVSNDERGRDTLKVAGAKLSKDRKSILLRIDKLKPSMQLRVQYSIESADGEEIKHDIYASVHTVPADDGDTVLDAAKLSRGETNR